MILNNGITKKINALFVNLNMLVMIYILIWALICIAGVCLFIWFMNRIINAFFKDSPSYIDKSIHHHTHIHYSEFGDKINHNHTHTHQNLTVIDDLTAKRARNYFD